MLWFFSLQGDELLQSWYSTHHYKEFLNITMIQYRYDCTEYINITCKCCI